MASYQKRKNSDGTTSIRAWVRIKPYKPSVKSFPDKKSAVAWAEAHEVELYKEHAKRSTRPDLTTLTVKQLIEAYLEDPNAKELRTYADIQRQLGWWISNYGSEKVFDLNTVQLREARSTLSNGRANATVNRHLSALRSAWSWGINAGYISRDHSWPNKLLLKEPKGRVRFLSDVELKNLLSVAKEPVMRTAILVSIATGVRQGELLRLQWKDIDLDGGKLTLLITKNDDPRSVFLGPVAVDALKSLKKLKLVSPTAVFLDDDGKPLSQMRLIYRWKALRKAANLENFRWHDLRHTCASVLAQNGANLLEIGERLGHKSQTVTLRYSHLVQGAPVKGDTALDAWLKGQS